MHISQTDAQNIVDEMKSSIHRDINIMDEKGIIQASTNPVRQGQLHHGALRVIREGLTQLTIWSDDPSSGVQRGINLPIIIRGQIEGVIGVTGDPKEVSVFGDVIKRMTEILVESTCQQEQLELREHARSLFVENWLFSDDPDWSELEIRGRLLDFDIHAPYTVALLEAAEQNIGKKTRTEDLSEMQSGLILRMLQSRLSRERHHFSAVIRRRIIVLLCGVSRKEAFESVSSVCRDIESFYGLRISAGISSPTASPAEIRPCYLQARTANAVAAQSETGRVVFYDQISLEFIVQSIPASIRQDLRRMVFASCTRQEQEEFLQTIRLYFEQGGDLQKCANALFIHRNTFQYRMDRIQKKTGYRLRNPRESLLLYVAAQQPSGGDGAK